jgi:hypothetical protein
MIFNSSFTSSDFLVYLSKYCTLLTSFVSKQLGSMLCCCLLLLFTNNKFILLKETSFILLTRNYI